MLVLGYAYPETKIPRNSPIMGKYTPKLGVLGYIGIGFLYPIMLINIGRRRL